MSKRPSLNHQINIIMQSMLRIGESRDEAKKEWKALHPECLTNFAEGIFSWNTYNSYKQTMVEFVEWLKLNYSNVKYVKDITKIMAIEYLQLRRDNNISAWTIDKDKAAINKVFKFAITKKEAGLPMRRYKNIKRSRLNKEAQRRYNPDNYKDAILFAKASGSRRESVLKVTFNDFVFKGDYVDSVYLKEKGGKKRYAPILNIYKAELTELVLKHKNEPDKPLFDSYTHQIDNHALRFEYANLLYKQFDEEEINNA